LVLGFGSHSNSRLPLSPFRLFRHNGPNVRPTAPSVRGQRHPWSAVPFAGWRRHACGTLPPSPWATPRSPSSSGGNGQRNSRVPMELACWLGALCAGHGCVRARGLPPVAFMAGTAALLRWLVTSRVKSAGTPLAPARRGELCHIPGVVTIQVLETHTDIKLGLAHLPGVRPPRSS
jgi:hypothetical protein